MRAGVDDRAYASYSRSPVVAGNRGAGVFRRLIRKKAAVAGFIVFLLICFACVAAPYLTKWKYNAINGERRLETPSFEHILGTDNLGRDLFARIIYGGRVTLKIALLSTSLAAVAGCVIGLVSGYFGSWADAVISPVLDMLAAVPIILLALVFEAVFGWGRGYFMYAMVIAAIPHFARMVRASVMNIMGCEYIEAAMSLGVSHTGIIFRHILHNIASPLVIRFTSGVAEALLTCTIMGYLSIGINPPTPEWGALAYTAKGYMLSHPYLMVISCSVIVVCVISINLFCDGLRDALDPKGNL